MNKSNIILGVLVVGLLSLTGYVATIDSGTTVIEKITDGKLGAIVDIPSQYLNWGGLVTYNFKVPTTATSAMICSVKNPANATTSIDHLSLFVTSNGIAGTQKISISTSTNVHASTTKNALVSQFRPPASKGFQILWTPRSISANTAVTGENTLYWSYDATTSPFFLAPNEYINFGVSTGTPGLYSTGYYTGYCSGSLKVLP